MTHKLNTLQVGRGVAAVAVLLYHVDEIAATGGQTFCHGIFRGLKHGVDFFFVLSGFIIFYTNYNQVGKPAAAPFYFYRRLVRIYPLLLVFIGVKLAYMLVDPASVPDHKKSLSYIVASMLLFPQEQLPFLDVAWTLSFEMFFYSIFLFAILFGRPVRTFCLLHALACLIFNLPPIAPLAYPASFLFSPHIIEFYIGAVIAWRMANPLAQFAPGPAAAALVAGLVVLAFGAWRAVLDGEDVWYLQSPYLWCVGSALVVYGIIVLERLHWLRAPLWMVFLGDASYSIYLAHTSFQKFLMVLVKRLGAGIGDHAQWVYWGIAAVSLGLTLGVYRWIEKPLLDWFHARGPRKPPVAPAGAIGVRQSPPIHATS